MWGMWREGEEAHLGEGAASAAAAADVPEHERVAIPASVENGDLDTSAALGHVAADRNHADALLVVVLKRGELGGLDTRR